MGSDIEKDLVDALADAHAMEKQSLTTLGASYDLALEAAGVADA